MCFVEKRPELYCHWVGIGDYKSYKEIRLLQVFIILFNGEINAFKLQR